jgi:predicted esterase
MEHHIKVSKTIRFEQNIPLSENTEALWFVLHGYGQLAKFFMKKFDELPNNQVIIAPEAPHRFYLSGNSGRVGASWMTKEWREQDIEDNLSSLNSIYKSLQPNIRSGVKLIVLGFSQGAATAIRWAASGSIAPHQLILWAGHIPPDMNYSIAQQQLLDCKIDVVVGNQDPYFSSENDADWRKLLTPAAIPFKSHSFHGGHEIDAETLLKLI